MSKMPKAKRFRVYLAGPIHGCNEAQRSHWRRRVRDKWGDRFEFVDPNDAIVAVQTTAEAGYEIIRRDQQAIRSCDAVLANMWRESVGTAIGIAHAKDAGKLVAVVDPNRIGNRILVFYADVVSDREDDALRQLLVLLELQSEIRAVSKKGGRAAEPFQREKLAASIRWACRAAGRDDVIVPTMVVPVVIEKLLVKGVWEEQVSAAMIRDAVWEVLAELEADPLRGDEYAGIRAAWERHDLRAKAGGAPLAAGGAGAGSLPAPAAAPEPEFVTVGRKPYHITVECKRTHSTIWGRNIKKLDDIPPPVRGVFREIACVSGIKRIRFGQFSRGGHEGNCRVEIMASKTPGFIEGKCYDSGVKGGLQTFHIEVLDPDQAEAVRRTLVHHLRGLGMLRIRE
jgi:hypothetical protein